MSYFNEKINCDTFVKSSQNYNLCGWNFINCVGNFGNSVTDKFGETIGDYFTYCANKSCENHGGVWYSLGQNPVQMLRG